MFFIFQVGVLPIFFIRFASRVVAPCHPQPVSIPVIVLSVSHVCDHEWGCDATAVFMPSAPMVLLKKTSHCGKSVTNEAGCCCCWSRWSCLKETFRFFFVLFSLLIEPIPEKRHSVSNLVVMYQEHLKTLPQRLLLLPFVFTIKLSLYFCPSHPPPVPPRQLGHK